MSKNPWFPFYVDDFLGSPKVRVMSCEEVGIYVFLLIEQYQTGHVLWPCSRKAQAMRVHEKPLTYVLESCFHEAAPGRWVNRRMQRILAEQGARVERGRVAAEARWGKNINESAAPDAVASSEHMLNGCMSDGIQIHNHKETYMSSAAPISQTGGNGKPKKPKTPPAYSAEFLAVWAIHHRGAKSKAFEEYRRAVRDGPPHATIVAALRLYTASFRADFRGADLFRWLRDRRWEEYEDVVVSVSGFELERRERGGGTP